MKDKGFVKKNGQPGKLRQFSIKDIHGSRNRFTIWDSFKNQDSFETGQVLYVTNLQTSIYPKDGPPFFLETTFRTTIRDASEVTYKEFEKVDDSDAV